MEEIVQWLEAGAQADYQAGVQLLAKHSKNRSLVNHLVKKDSHNNREKLTYELVKLGCGHDLADTAEVLRVLGNRQAVEAAVSEFAEAVAGAAPAPRPQPEPAPAPEAEHVPEAVRTKVDDITQLMATLWADRCQRSDQLDAASQEQGQVLVADILRLQEQYNALAERRRQLIAGEATGQLEAAAPGAPAPEPAAPETPAAVDVLELGDRLRNLRSNLSKAKGKLARKPDDAALQEKVVKLTLEKDQLELQLKKATE
ncbi:hypothetical protein GCM10027048_20340 [Hymenobacter coalescens]